MTLADRDLLDAPAPHRWTFDDYMRAAEAGIFDSQPVELIEGELIDRPAEEDPPVGVLSRLPFSTCMIVSFHFANRIRASKSLRSWIDDRG